MEITPEIARIHAHICGDGCVYLKREKRPKNYRPYRNEQLYENVWLIEYTNTSFQLLDEFNKDLKAAFNRKGQFRLKYWRIRISSAKWIIDALRLRGKNSYNWFIPDFILKQNNAITKHWLRAFFDDESTVTDYGAIRIKCMNMNGLRQIRDLLLRFEIVASLTGPNCDKSYYLYVPKKYGRQYQESVGFLHPEKKIKLERIINGPTALLQWGRMSPP